MKSSPERIKVKDVARISGETERTIQAAAARGEIPGAAKLFKAWTFDEVKLRKWIAAKEREAGAARFRDSRGLGDQQVTRSAITAKRRNSPFSKTNDGQYDRAMQRLRGWVKQKEKESRS
ncbi:hypothetical protein [Bradyrhizobium sp. AZCC 2289]|uniref:hypothetical protein n=1 Tax=Bradyrhizobium sp. AZCC 2289 TaxID=3117026 RepID=UPI002FF3ED81